MSYDMDPRHCVPSFVPQNEFPVGINVLPPVEVPVVTAAATSAEVVNQAVLAKAHILLKAYRRRFMPDATLFGHEVGRTPEKGGTPYHANPVKPGRGSMPQFNPHTERFEKRSLTPRRWSNHICGRQAMFSIAQSQTWGLAWVKSAGHALEALGRAAGIDLTAEESDALLETQGRVGFSPAQAMKLLRATAGRNLTSYQKLRNELLSQQDSVIRRIKFALLDIDKADFWRLRRTLERLTTWKYRSIDVTEITIDIDGNKLRGDAAEEAIALARRIEGEILSPLGLTCHIEPSRNGRGAYVRFRVRWHTHNHELRNRIILGFQRALASQFPTAKDIKAANKQGEIGPPAGIDMVRGLATHWQVNQQFDEEAFYGPPFWAEHEDQIDGSKPNAGEIYRAQQRRDGPAGPYNPKFEKLIRIHAGDLVTAPLFGIERLEPQQAEERLQAWKVYDASRSNTVCSGTFAAAFPPVSVQVAVAEAHERESPDTPEDVDIPIHGYALSSEQFPDPATHTPIKCPLPRSGAALAALSSTKEDEGPAGFLARRSKLAAYALRRANGDRFLAIGYTLFLWGHAHDLTSQGACHPGRVSKAIHDVDFWLCDDRFNMTLCQRASSTSARKEPRPSDDDIAATQVMLATLYGEKTLLDSIDAIAASRKYSRRQMYARRDDYLRFLAVTHCMLSVGVVTERDYTLLATGVVRTGKRGDMPASAIATALEKAGCVATRAVRTVSILTEALLRHWQFVQVLGASPGQSNSYKLGPAYQVLPWVAGSIQPADWQAVDWVDSYALPSGNCAATRPCPPTFLPLTEPIGVRSGWNYPDLAGSHDFYDESIVDPAVLDAHYEARAQEYMETDGRSL